MCVYFNRECGLIENKFKPKASVTTTGRTCLVIVCVPRVLSLVAPVADRTVKKPFEVIESAALNKRTFHCQS